MKELTKAEQIEKLENKISKLNAKLSKLKTEEDQEKRKEAFDKIMELGEEYNLFRDVTLNHNIGFTNVTTEYKVTIIDPNPVEIKHH